MIITAERRADQTAFVHVLPLGSSVRDYLTRNDVVPVATYSCTGLSRAEPSTPASECIEAVQALHPGHALWYWASDRED